MVPRITVVSKYNIDPPTDENDLRNLDCGPLYDTNDVLLAAVTVQFWTRKCKNDIFNLSLDEDQVPKLIQEALSYGQYRKSEWCVQKPGGPWAACDVYTVKRKEEISTRVTEVEVEYYIKFAIARTGKAILMASCHVSI